MTGALRAAVRDPLLMAGKVIAVFMQVAMAIGAVGLLIAMPALLAASAGWIDGVDLTEAGIPADFPLWALIGVMLIGLAIVVMMFLFFGKLRQIIDTVRDGDPFQPENARRLNAMGWLMLAVQAAFLPAMGLAMYMAPFADGSENIEINGGDGSGLDISGILLVIILFILARVFRHGAAMREDLEGTV